MLEHKHTIVLSGNARAVALCLYRCDLTSEPVDRQSVHIVNSEDFASDEYAATIGSAGIEDGLSVLVRNDLVSIRDGRIKLSDNFLTAMYGKYGANSFYVVEDVPYSVQHSTATLELTY